MNKIVIPPILIWYYYICPREVWLMSHQLVPDQQNDNIEIGRFIHKDSYHRNKKEIVFGNAKFDIIKRTGNTIVVGEIKKTSHYEEASKMQLAYYLYLLKQEGITAQGELLYPKEKKKTKLVLTDDLIIKIKKCVCEIQNIIAQSTAPPVAKIKWCKNCAYKEFCLA